MADIWRKDGHTVKFLFGTGKFVPADICFVHVDLSVAPNQYLEFAIRYPVVINGYIKNILKSRLVKIWYQGTVVIKLRLI